MGKITRQLVAGLTPLEKESAEWCYEKYRDWLAQNVKKTTKVLFLF